MANMFTYFLFQWLNDELIVKKLVNSITIEYDEDVSIKDKQKIDGKILSILLPLRLNICFGCSKEPSQ